MVLRTGQGRIVGVCTSGASGCCTFPDLEPGTYRLNATAVEGFFFTTVPTVEVDVFAGRVSEASFGSRPFFTALLPVVMKHAELRLYLPPMLKRGP